MARNGQGKGKVRAPVRWTKQNKIDIDSLNTNQPIRLQTFRIDGTEGDTISITLGEGCHPTAQIDDSLKSLILKKLLGEDRDKAEEEKFFEACMFLYCLDKDLVQVIEGRIRNYGITNDNIKSVTGLESFSHLTIYLLSTMPEEMDVWWLKVHAGDIDHGVARSSLFFGDITDKMTKMRAEHIYSHLNLDFPKSNRELKKTFDVSPMYPVSNNGEKMSPEDLTRAGETTPIDSAFNKWVPEDLSRGWWPDKSNKISFEKWWNDYLAKIRRMKSNDDPTELVEFLVQHFDDGLGKSRHLFKQEFIERNIEKFGAEVERFRAEVDSIDNNNATTANPQKNRRSQRILSQKPPSPPKKPTKKKHPNATSSRGCAAAAAAAVDEGRKDDTSARKRAPRKCKHGGCNKWAVQGGVCIAHGATYTKKLCSSEGCTNQAQRGGVCKKHGAQVERKRCSFEECTNFAQNGGVCKQHGANVKLCKIEGCPRQAQRGGVCKHHGTNDL